MMEKFPAAFEPVMIVLPQPEARDLTALDSVLNQLKNEGLIETSSSPSALVLDTERIRTNAEYARSRDLAASRRAFEQAIADSGLTASAFAETFKVLEGLEEIDNSRLSWSRFLSSTSPWWFLFDRMISPDSGAAIAYARTQPQITGSQRERIAELVEAAVPSALVTGWSQALTSLTAWARKELIVFGGAVSLIILIILGLVYRNAQFWAFARNFAARRRRGNPRHSKASRCPHQLAECAGISLDAGCGRRLRNTSDSGCEGRR